MIRAVVDTNVFLRAVIKPEGSVAPVLNRMRSGEYVAVYSAPLLDELKEKLSLERIRRKYDITDEDAVKALEGLLRRGDFVNPAFTLSVCRDPDDNRVIEAAVERKRGMRIPRLGLEVG